jgi:glyoxylase-like metal-dependent hydrolase (beta-lactamase superfamily II)
MHFDHVGGLLAEGVKERLRTDLRVHVSSAEAEFWKSPDFSRTAMPPALVELARRASLEFLGEYSSHLRTFIDEAEVAPGVVVTRTGGHTPGHSVVRLTSGGERLMFAGDAIFPVSFEHPEWHNGFEHDPEEATRVRLRLMRELATNGSWLVSTHLPFPSVGRVAAANDLFRWVPVWWDF